MNEAQPKKKDPVVTESINVEEEEDVYEITIRGKKYYATNEKNGTIYAIDKDGEVGPEVGKFVNGIAKI